MSFRFLQLIILFFLLLTESSTLFKNRITQAYSSNVTDQQALLSFKAYITGDPPVLRSWNHSIHFCQWKGVSCSQRSQRVTKLDLSSQQLDGTLSPHIGNLSFLIGIYLQKNNFRGSIPVEISQLFRLRYFHLGSNYFQGGLPMNLSHCSDIRNISIENNNLGGKLPTAFASWSKLRVFNAWINQFTGSIPTSVGNMSNLRFLDISTNHLSGSIPSEVTQLLKLKYFLLAENNLSGIVPSTIYNISSLYVLVLAQNELEGTLPADLGLTLPFLQIYYAGLNKFSGPFPPSMVNASKLVDFDISSNNISGPLPMNFGNLLNLRVLNLGRNQLGHNQPPGLRFLNSLVNSTLLKFLGLDKNGLTGELIDFIANISTTLDDLDFSGNYIYGNIPKEIGKLSNMTELALYQNMLSGSIPQSVCELIKLGNLFLFDNNISGVLPACISNMTGLLILHLGNNKLHGNIPTALLNISSLQELYLFNNHLSGVIPEHIIGLSSQCIILHLHQNLLTGPLPYNIGSLIHLVELLVYENKLTGEITTGLGGCVMLEKLDMRRNFFKGSIPYNFFSLKSLAILDLSVNNLSGNIPHFLGELHLIQFLDLSQNELGGEVPKNGLFSNVSAFSVVGNVQLCGGIQTLKLPACPANISKTKKRQFPLKIIPLMVLLPLATILAGVTFYLHCFKKSKQKNIQILLSKDGEYPKLSYQDLLLATVNFSRDNLLGVGRYGTVYKGIIESLQQIVAVKVLNVDTHGFDKNFLAECETLRNVRHRNLIKIITACSSIDYKGTDFKALIYEYMSNGSLDYWLYPSPSDDQGNQRNLTLFQRLNIVIDIALALDYLHHHCHSKIIHCDIKPSNILLDEEFVAHVGDFGLAKIFLTGTGETSVAQTSSTGVRGTVGYVPPEYGMGGMASVEGDVYSYGILLLEMFSGQRPTGSILTDNASTLHDHVKKALPHRVMEITDPRMILQQHDHGSREDESTRMEVCLVSIFEVGVLCSAAIPRKRIDISVAVKQLEVARDNLMRRK